uniref:Uncharacterized protein n=1 Tax=Tanacetum cinerariifolium TaxID=118510 RepID=A0A699HQ39_TANCI|nr:hypothetical protein [Tanacetum cinerariifolium]GEY57139.1 hypothetical protein [Tanacetum cinerariifolium]
MHHQTPPLLIHLHHQDLFIHHFLGLYDVARPIFVGGLPLLFTMYPPTTSESSAGDSSSESYVGPSRKRCRSPAATVTLSIHATRALVSSRADLLPTHKRADAIAIEVAVERDVEVGVDVGIGMEVDVRINVEEKVEYEVKSSDRGTIKVGVDVVTGIDIPDGMLIPDAVERLEQAEEELEVRSLIAGGDRASLLEQVSSLERSNARLRGTMMKDRARADRFQRHMSFIKSELRQIHRFRYYGRMRFRILETFSEVFGFSFMMLCVNFRLVVELVALATYEASRTANVLEAKSQSQNNSDDDNENGGNGNGRNGNGKNRNGGNGNPNENDRVLGLFLESVHTKTSENVNHATSREQKELSG